MPDFREIVFSLGIDQETASKITSLLEEANGVKPDLSDIPQIATLFSEKFGINHDESLRLASSTLLEDGKAEVYRKMKPKLKEAAILLARAKPSLNIFTAFRQIYQTLLKAKEGDREFRLEYYIKKAMEYPRDIDLEIFEPDKYKGTENYFTCSFVPWYLEEPLRHFTHVLSFADTNALSALTKAQNSGGRLYSLLLQKLVVSDKPWPEEEPSPVESCVLRPGNCVIIVPCVDVQGKVPAVEPTLLVFIHSVYDTFEMASWSIEKIVPYRAMLAKIFAVIWGDGGGEAKGVKMVGGKFEYL
ncbi:MAG: hypothetical protein HXY53_05640 [Nitrospirae bacterium]|nr:hypothetical protein [Nitrospirota bacterium]